MDTFAISLFPWFRAKVYYDDKKLTIESNNNVFIIPAGKKIEVISLKDISSCSISTYYDASSIIIGCILCLLAVFGQTVVHADFFVKITIMVISAILGILFVLSGIAASFTIEKKGMKTEFFIPFYSRKTAENTIKNIQTKLNEAEINRSVQSIKRKEN